MDLIIKGEDTQMGEEPLSAAVTLMIRNAASMTDEGREQIAAWLRRQADSLLQDGTKYSKTFLARYLYADKEGNG